MSFILAGRSSNTSSPDFWVEGWVSQPGSRGTYSILLSCLSTMFICSWSALCLHMVDPSMSNWSFLKHKLRWQLFAFFFPEVLTSMAAEQWESANQSVETFRALHYDGWTMSHAFFADMGGFVLCPPDSSPFPVAAEQIAYLVKKQHLKYPDIPVDTIWDRNKADGLARLTTCFQITWFSLQCLARWQQRLAITSLEITSFASVVATVNSFFFWYRKPLDPRTPVRLQTEVSMSEILRTAEAAGYRTTREGSKTPLDFLKSPAVRTSIVAPFWFGFKFVLNIDKDSGHRPSRTIENSETRPPQGITTRETMYGVLFELVYFGIHLTGWNEHFPSRLELELWRASNLTLIGLLFLYLIIIPLSLLFSKPFSERWLPETVDTPLEVAAQLPRWAQQAIHLPVLTVYIIARSYILLEGLVSLRALPHTAYSDVSWSNFLPHF